MHRFPWQEYGKGTGQDYQYMWLGGLCLWIGYHLSFCIKHQTENDLPDCRARFLRGDVYTVGVTVGRSGDDRYNEDIYTDEAVTFEEAEEKVATFVKAWCERRNIEVTSFK